LLSTTDRPVSRTSSHSRDASQRDRQHGQALVIFALAGMVLIGTAAMAFDTGMILLEKRTQQNAADAAALAGARFLPGNHDKASNQAFAVATANGFADGSGDVTVNVTFPTSGQIRVSIDNDRAPIFARIFGINNWDVGSTALATNESRPSGPFALLTLRPDCHPGGGDYAPLLLAGTGLITSSGNIHVNSSCASGNGAMRLAGQGDLRLNVPGIGCNVVGLYTYGGGATSDCHPPNGPEQGVVAIDDPYANLPYPPIPSPYVDEFGVSHLARPPQQVSGTTRDIPTGCPGSTEPATHATPSSCKFEGSYDGTTWRLYAGYYPGGIDLRRGTFYLEPGIYYLAGGCREADCPRTGSGDRYTFRAAGGGNTGGGVTVMTVDAGGTTFGGGIMLFNGKHSASPAWPDGMIYLQGGSSTFKMLPLDQDTEWDNFLIFQHRDNSQPVRIEGGNSEMDLRGIIYAPGADISAKGNAGTITVDQIIASSAEIRGGGGTINITYDWDHLPLLRMAGLIE
jgi:Flp pilus assembly protein TadG